MKKVSFLIKFLIVLTVLSVTAFYVFTRYYDQLIVTPVKKFVINYAAGDVIKEIGKIKDTPEKAMLVTEMSKFTDYVLSQKVIKLDPLQKVAETLGKAIEDSSVTHEELEQIIKQFNKYKNERYQEN